MENPAPRSHPLNVTGPQRARVPEAVPVRDGPFEHIGDGLDPPVRMPGKSRAIVFRTIVAEVVEQEEWIEFARIPKAEGATQLDARTLDCRFGLNDSFDRSN